MDTLVFVIDCEWHDGGHGTDHGYRGLVLLGNVVVWTGDDLFNHTEMAKENAIENLQDRMAKLLGGL